MARGRMLNNSQRLGHIYLIFHPETGAYKIGISKNVKERLAKLRSEHGKLEIIRTVESFQPRDDEWMLHKHFRAKRITGEWFALNSEDTEEFYDYCNIIEMQTRTMKEHIENVRRNVIRQEETG